MNANVYQQEALRTERGMEKRPNMDYNTARLLNGLMGLNGEAGEAIDILKKYLFQGHVIDKYHLAKELGDIAWYLAVAADALGYDLSTIFEMNVQKLKDRYPNGFEARRSLHREDGDV